MDRTLARDALFEGLVREFKRQFETVVDNLQSSMENVIEEHLAVVGATLDLIRSENVASESEQNPEFRLRVEAQIVVAQDEIGRIQAVVHP